MHLFKKLNKNQATLGTDDENVNIVSLFKLVSPLSIYFVTVYFAFVKQNIYVSKERTSELFCYISILLQLDTHHNSNLLQFNYKTYVFNNVYLY